MGLLRNLFGLANNPTPADLISRITAVERRQELLEDYTDQKLDMMKSYSARVMKRERDAQGRPRSDDLNAGGVTVPLANGNARVARLMERRAARGHDRAT